MNSNVKLYEACPRCPNLGVCSAINDVKLRKSLCPYKHKNMDEDGMERVNPKDYTGNKYRKFRKKKAKKTTTKRKTKGCGCK
jgi:hypothetical protein